MAIKIEIILTALVITDTVTAKTLVDTPKHLVYYDVNELENNGNIRIVNIDTSDAVRIHRNFPDYPIGANVIDGSNIAYDEASFKVFARTNLGS